jgi:pyrrolidone-carboxylate peptidase
MKVVVGAFGDFLQFDTNSSEKLLDKIPASANLAKVILPVGYFSGDFIRPLRKHPSAYVILGMWQGKYCRFETVARNEMIVLKSPLQRCAVTAYSRMLKLFGRNFRVKGDIEKERLTTMPIRKGGVSKIKLGTKPPKISDIRASEDADNFVCNYAAWVVENYIRDKKLGTKFYFIHVPSKYTKKQETAVLSFVESLIK